jgi:hypothetical protein
MKEIDVKWWTQPKSISQVYSQGVEYAFVSKNFEMIHQPVHCKDFMQDAISGVVQEKKVSIYGFTYDPKSSLPIYTRKTRLLITDYCDKSFGDKIPHAIDFLHQVESKLKMARTKVKKVSNPPKKYKFAGAYVFDGSPRWMISPPMISMYTLLMRIGLVHIKGDEIQNTMKGVIDGSIKPMQNDDKHQLKQAKKAISWILKLSDKKLFFRQQAKNYTGQKKTVSINDMHNNLGLVAYSHGASKKFFPKWYEEVK